jgi:hypothetical protein
MRPSRAGHVAGWLVCFVMGVSVFKTAPWILWGRLATIGLVILIFAPVVIGLYAGRIYEWWRK